MTFNWNQHQTAAEAVQHLFNNDFISDITFVCDVKENKVIYAHSFELIKRSPKFYANYKNNIGVCKVIPVTDYSYEVFYEFIKFIYTDSCQLNSDNVLDLMKVANEYSVKMLEQRCTNLIIDQLSHGTVCMYLEISVEENYDYIRHWALQYIQKHFADVVKAESFTNIDKKTLKYIIDSEPHDGSREIDIFHAAMKWAERTCRREKIEVSGANKRNVLGDLIKHIRFPIMGSEDFSKCTVEEPGLLTDEETLSISLSITLKKKNEFGFYDEERQPPPATPKTVSFRNSVKNSEIEDHTKFEVIYFGSGPIAYVDLNAHCFYTELTVSNPITIVGLTVLGTMAKAALFIKIKDVATDRVLRQVKVTSFEDRAGVLRADVRLPALPLKPNTDYCILYFYTVVCKDHFAFIHSKPSPWIVQLPNKNVELTIKNVNRNLEKLWVL